MKPDWDALGAEFKDHPKVVIADVDCTAAGKPLCDKFGVRGYPTIKCAARPPPVPPTLSPRAPRAAPRLRRSRLPSQRAAAPPS